MARQMENSTKVKMTNGQKRMKAESVFQTWRKQIAHNGHGYIIYTLFYIFDPNIRSWM